MDQVFHFGSIALTVCNDVPFTIRCLAQESMGILSVYSANVHGGGRVLRWDGGSGNGHRVLFWDNRSRWDVIAFVIVAVK
jgi:hypothetical protein